MNTLNKTISALAIATLLSVGGSVFAAQGERMAGPDLEPIFTELNVTADQQAQVEQILEELREGDRGPRDNSGTRPTREEHEAMLQEKNAALENSLLGVLSADQTVELMNYLAEQKPEGGRQERN